MRKISAVLYYLGLVIFFVGIGSIAISCVFEIIGNQSLSDIFGIIAAAAGTLSLTIFIVRVVIFGFQFNASAKAAKTKTYTYEQKPVKTVDVKPVPKSKEEELYEQYENLYKQGLITKEDLDKKHEELLGK